MLHASAPAPHLLASHVAASPEEARHFVPGAGRFARHLHPSLWPPRLPLPPRWPPAYRPAPHLQGKRQDAIGLRPPSAAPRGPPMARRTPSPQATTPRDPQPVGGAATG